MRHVVFALFDDAGQEEAALREMEGVGISRQSCHVTEHRDRISVGDLNLEESGGRRGLILGILAGAVVGGILGALTNGFVDLLRIGLLAAIAAGAVSGALFGGLAGVLTGAGRVNRHLERLSQGLAAGKVLVTLIPEGAIRTHRVRRIFHKHGAHEVGVVHDFVPLAPDHARSIL